MKKRVDNTSPFLLVSLITANAKKGSSKRFFRSTESCRAVRGSVRGSEELAPERLPEISGK